MRFAKMRSPSPGARSGPQVKQVRNGMPVVGKSRRRLGWDVDDHGIRGDRFADRFGDSDYVTAV